MYHQELAVLSLGSLYKTVGLAVGYQKIDKQGQTQIDKGTDRITETQRLGNSRRRGVGEIVHII